MLAQAAGWVPPELQLHSHPSHFTAEIVMVKDNAPQPVKLASQAVAFAAGREVASDVREPAGVNVSKLWYLNLLYR